MREFGWGMIYAVFLTLLSWWFVAALGHSANPGILFGTLGLGGYYVYKGGVDK